jgi:hypothetical protein
MYANGSYLFLGLEIGYTMRNPGTIISSSVFYFCSNGTTSEMPLIASNSALVGINYIRLKLHFPYFLPIIPIIGYTY